MNEGRGRSLRAKRERPRYDPQAPHERRIARKLARGDALQLEALRGRVRRGEATPADERMIAALERRITWLNIRSGGRKVRA